MTAPKDLINNPSKRICPGSFADLDMPAQPVNPNAPPLRRWKATWDTLRAELVGESPPDGHFDPVQAEIVAAQIRAVKPLLPTAGLEKLDCDWPKLHFPIGPKEELTVYFQFTHHSPDGLLKMYKLKSAQIREEQEFVTSPEEIAVVVSDPRFPDSLEAYEIRTADGEMIRLEMSTKEATKVLTELTKTYQKMANSEPRLVEGAHCSTCRVADLCDVFPTINPTRAEVVSFGRRKPSGYRVMISKSRLPEMDYCQRRVAWKVVFAIPPDSDFYSLGTPSGLAVGNRFHNLMAEALLSDDPASFFSDDPATQDLYQQHLALACTPNLDILKTEFPLGTTVRFGAGERPVSVVLYGIADGVGREADGTPAVIDHKTGSSPQSHPYEAQVYALGTLVRLPDAPVVATHIHKLSTTGRESECERKIWKREQMNELVEPLAELAKTAAGWSHADATHPPFQVGEWCSTCPFEKRCMAHR